MSDPIIMISSAIITRDELSKFITQMGGDVELSGAIAGTLQRDHSAVWIGLSPVELESVMEMSGDQVKSKLAAIPSTLVVVEMLPNEKSRKQAVEFAIQFTARWPAICSDGQGGFLSHDELIPLRGADRNLSFC